MNGANIWADHKRDQDAGWPESGLESVSMCPVCSSSDRILAHGGLTDTVFRVAGGRWDSWQCTNCHSLYLDPRPTMETIELAYRNYYTHGGGGMIRKPPAGLCRMIENSYLNARHGTSQKPALRLASILPVLIPSWSRSIDDSLRWLPSLLDANSKRLLDIGCGSGRWLQAARKIGWSVAGCDTDAGVQAIAQSSDIEVRQGGGSAWLDQAGTFDAITMNHSIEHFHDPASELKNALNLLKSGGQLTVETPNADSWGHLVYGRNWLGLDPPRHLLVYSRDGLATALRQVGFVEIKQRPKPSVFATVSRYSGHIAQGGSIMSKPSKGIGWHLAPFRAAAYFSRKRADFIVFTGIKP